MNKKAGSKPKKSTNSPNDMADVDDKKSIESARHDVRLTTVYGGRVCQYGKAYECIISDVSIGGAKVKLKNPQDFKTFVSSTPAQLVFERLTDYNALNADVSWLKPKEFVVGLEFIDTELRRRVVIKRLMPNRWRIANAKKTDAHSKNDQDETQD